MTARDFDRVKSMIKAVFPRVEYLDNQDTATMFFNILNRYDYQDVWQGVRDCLEVERYVPAISVVVQYIESAERARQSIVRSASSAKIPSMTVKCAKCNDAGFQWVTYKDGTTTARICDCETAREQNPWAFMSQRDYEEAHEKQRKRGQNPPIGRPGNDSEWWKGECGEVVSVSPGKRPPAPKKER